MAIYLKKFETQAAYEAAQSSLILPNVSLTVDNNTVHYNPSTPPTPPTETRLVCTYYVEDVSSETQLYQEENNFSSMEIDGVEQAELVQYYQFGTTGEHTVKYTLIDPTTIEGSTFQSRDSLTSIVIPNSVTSIGDYAFEDCISLTSCTIGSGITSIGNYAFHECSGLTSIDISSGVTSINEGTFKKCHSLSSVTLGNSVTSIGDYAFYECSGLTSINIPNSVISIGSYAFGCCFSLDSTTTEAIEAINPNDAFYCD